MQSKIARPEAYELLIRLDEKVTNLTRTVDALSDNTISRLDSHDSRLETVEKQIEGWKVVAENREKVIGKLVSDTELLKRYLYMGLGACIIIDLVITYFINRH